MVIISKYTSTIWSEITIKLYTLSDRKTRVNFDNLFIENNLNEYIINYLYEHHSDNIKIT